MKIFIIITFLFSAYINAKELSKQDIIKALDANNITFDNVIPQAQIFVDQIAKQKCVQLLRFENKNVDNATLKKECFQEYGPAIKAKALEGFYETQTMMFPFFHKDFLNIRSLDYGLRRFSVIFDYTKNQCLLVMDKLSPVCGEPFCGDFIDYQGKGPHPNHDSNPTTIDMKYCKKLYGEDKFQFLNKK